MNLDKIRRLRDQYKDMRFGGTTDVVYFKPQKGSNIIRVLPIPNSDIAFKQQGWHYIAKGKSYLCPRINNHEDCPICEIVTELFRSNIKADKDLAKRWMVQIKAAFNILDRSDNKVKIWITSPKIYHTIIDILAEWEQTYGNVPDFSDPYKGRDFNLRMVPPKTEDGVVQYELLLLDPKPVATSKKEIEAILKQVYNLDEVFTVMDYDQLVKVVEGLEAMVGDSIPEVKSSGEKLGGGKPRCFGTGEVSLSDDACKQCEFLEECYKKPKDEGSEDDIVDLMEDEKEFDNTELLEDKDEKIEVERKVNKKGKVADILSKYRKSGKK